MTNRIQRIRSMLTDNPSDVFLQYSLGMECASAGRGDESIEAMRRCLEIQPDYIPAAVELGKGLRAARRLEEAREAFENALKLAEAQGDSHIAANVRAQIEGL